MRDDTRPGTESDPVDDDPWTPVAGTRLLDEFVIDDLDAVADLTHPVRGLLLRRLRRPQTVAELAAKMDVPVTRLYHHVNRLESLGFIQVVATRKVAAVTERRYGNVAKTYRLSEEILESADPAGLARALGSVFEMSKLSLQRQVEAGRLPAGDEQRLALAHSELRLSPARRAELIARIESIVDEFESDVGPDEDGEAVVLLLAAFVEQDE